MTVGGGLLVGMILKIQSILWGGTIIRLISNWAYQLQMLGLYIWHIMKGEADIKGEVIELSHGFYQWQIKYKDKPIGIKYNITAAKRN